MRPKEKITPRISKEKQDNVRRFFKDRPSLTAYGISHELLKKGESHFVSASHLRYIIQGRAITENVFNRILPVLEKYGYK